VVIKGAGQEDAVLCTSNKTFALKLVETTNTLLLLPPQQVCRQTTCTGPCSVSITVGILLQLSFGCRTWMKILQPFPVCRLQVSGTPPPAPCRGTWMFCCLHAAHRHFAAQSACHTAEELPPFPPTVQAVQQMQPQCEMWGCKPSCKRWAHSSQQFLSEEQPCLVMLL